MYVARVPVGPPLFFHAKERNDLVSSSDVDVGGCDMDEVVCIDVSFVL